MVLLNYYNNTSRHSYVYKQTRYPLYVRRTTFEIKKVPLDLYL